MKKQAFTRSSVIHQQTSKHPKVQLNGGPVDLVSLRISVSFPGVSDIA